MEYPVNADMKKRIEHNFTHHPPVDDQAERYERIRAAAKELATLVIRLSPPSREQSMALTDLEDMVMHANAAIARNEAKS